MKLKAISKKKPITYLQIPYDTVKSIDVDSELVVELYYQESLSDVNGLEYFRLTKDSVTYSDVTDYTVKNGVVRFKMPPLLNGRYYPEIKDIEGKLYSSSNFEYFDVVKSLSEVMQLQYPKLSEMIINDMTPFIIDYVDEHSTHFRGQKGEKGDRGINGKTGRDGRVSFEQLTPGQKESLKGDKGDVVIPSFELNENGDLYYYLVGE